MNYINLFVTEIKKFRHNSAVVFLFALFTLLGPLIIFGGKELFGGAPPPFPSTSTFYILPNIYDYQAYIFSWLSYFFGGFIMINMICSEVSYKTMRQNIITGYTRKEYFMGKFISLVVFCIFATVLYTVSSAIIGAVHTPEVSFADVMDANYAPGRVFLMTFGFLSFAFFVAFWIRRGGLAIFFYFAYGLMLEPIIKWLSLFGIKKAKGEFNAGIDTIVNYWPMNAMEDLTPNPMYRLPGFVNNGDMNLELLLPYQNAAIATALYSVLFIGLSYYLLIKKDV